MNDASVVGSAPSRILRLLLVDDDPIFRVGLRTCLADFPDLRVVGEANTPTAALQTLSQSPEDAATATTGTPIDLVILNLDLNRSASQAGVGLQLCQQLKTLYPALPVLLLSAVPDPTTLASAFQTGAEGYCSKGTAIAELVTAIRQVAVGRAYWNEAMQVMARSLTAAPSNPVLKEQSIPRRQVAPAGWLTRLRYNWRQSGFQQIDVALAQVNTLLASVDLSQWDRIVLEGQRRELRTARWLVSRLLATPAPPQSATASNPAAPVERPQLDRTAAPIPIQTTTLPNAVALSPPGLTSELATESGNDYRTIRAALFDRIFASLQTSLHNATDAPLEIDILRDDRKRELLHIILRQLETVMDELRFSQVPLDHLLEKRSSILHDLWQAATTEFFGKYYTVQIGQRALEVVSTLQQDAAIVQESILDKIPMVVDLLAALLFQMPVTIDNVAYPIQTPEALERAEALLQNLMIQTACAVIQPLLNRFADVEAIKQGFYDRRLLSTREIERFRNNLSWKYRVEYWFVEPKAIFESQFRLFVLTDRGIKQTTLYASRNRELAQLSGVRYAVTLALETRDALSPRLRSAVAFVGSGVVYLLTEVVGRGIGLIGRGIIKGIGNAFQENKFGRN